jgi:alpha-glucosidase (family GH31 glycosyl hydrolase)
MIVRFDTKNVEHGFVFSDQFIQILLNTNYKNVYGFGENTHYSFKHRFEYTQFWPIFARDQPTGAKYLNYYGTHPFFMAVDENTGRAYGVLIFNSNAMEYGFLPPHVISYRTTGGILDMYIMEEESPEKLIQAYTSLIGNPYMVPYWSLGFQLCRYGYNSIDNMKAVVERTRKAGIPQDVQYGDIDHFYKNLDFTYDPVTFKGLPDYINKLNETGIRFIIILVRIDCH